jgi:hypothetical protein
MMWNQIVGPLGGAVIAFVGVLASSAFSGWRDRKARRDVHFSHVLDRRYTLYIAYLDVLDRNADVFSGHNVASVDPDDLINELNSLERQMQVFASRDVLRAFGDYRECVRSLASASADSPALAAIRRQGHRNSKLSLAMVRADLKIDSYDSAWDSRRRRWMAVKLADDESLGKNL